MVVGAQYARGVAGVGVLKAFGPAFGIEFEDSHIGSLLFSNSWLLTASLGRIGKSVHDLAAAWSCIGTATGIDNVLLKSGAVGCVLQFVQPREQH